MFFPLHSPPSSLTSHCCLLNHNFLLRFNFVWWRNDCHATEEGRGGEGRGEEKGEVGGRGRAGEDRRGEGRGGQERGELKKIGGKYQCFYTL